MPESEEWYGDVDDPEDPELELELETDELVVEDEDYIPCIV